MKYRTLWLIGSCTVSGLVAAAVFLKKNIRQRPPRDFPTDLKLLAAYIENMVNDPEATIEDMHELVPVCLELDCALRDANPLGCVPDPGITAILNRCIAMKAMMTADP